MTAPRFTVGARPPPHLEALDLGEGHMAVLPVAREDHELVLAVAAQEALHGGVVAEVDADDAARPRLLLGCGDGAGQGDHGGGKDECSHDGTPRERRHARTPYRAA